MADLVGFVEAGAGDDDVLWECLDQRDLDVEAVLDENDAREPWCHGGGYHFCQRRW